MTDDRPLTLRRQQMPLRDSSSRAFDTRFTDFFDHLDELNTVRYLSQIGLLLARDHPEKVYGKPEPGPGLNSAVAARVKELLKEGPDQAASKVNCQALVFYWGSFEMLMRDFLATWLETVDRAREVQGVRGIKHSVVDLQELDEHGTWLYVVDTLERNAHRDPGQPAFKKTLHKFELYPKVSPDVETKLVEMEHIRHALVHRRGLATNTLSKHCPQLGLAVGEPLQVTELVFDGYWHAVLVFCKGLMARACELQSKIEHCYPRTT